MPVISRRKVYAVKIKADNDTYGNPRRGWGVYLKDGEYVGFVDEGYDGNRALTSRFPNATELCHIATNPGTYKSYKKDAL